MSDNDTRREQIVRAWEDAWDRGETAGMEALLSPDYRRITATNQDGENREQFLAVIQTTREAFPDLTTVVASTRSSSRATMPRSAGIRAGPTCTVSWASLRRTERSTSAGRPSRPSRTASSFTNT